MTIQYYAMLVNGLIKYEFGQEVPQGCLSISQSVADCGAVKIENGELVIDLAKYKTEKIKIISTLSFEKLSAIAPKYVQENALSGVYEDASCEYPKVINSVTLTKSIMIKTISAFQKEYYRIKGLIESAESESAINAIEDNFPTQLVTE